MIICQGNLRNEFLWINKKTDIVLAVSVFFANFVGESFYYPMKSVPCQ